jgi:hypothetical protein
VSLGLKSSSEVSDESEGVSGSQISRYFGVCLDDGVGGEVSSLGGDDCDDDDDDDDDDLKLLGLMYFGVGF